jgi:hypothetical protein
VDNVERITFQQSEKDLGALELEMLIFDFPLSASLIVEKISNNDSLISEHQLTFCALPLPL